MVGGDTRARRHRPAAVRRPQAARGRLRPRRPGRHRALHQDGPQRHRVRDHAGLRRGLRAAGPVRPRHRRRRRARRVAHGLGGALVAARPAGAGAAADARPGGHPGYAADSGEGRWTVQEAIERGVATPVISAALFARFVSQHDDSIAMKAIAALRNQFGGHAVLPETRGAEGDQPVEPPSGGPRPDADIRAPAATPWCCSAPPATWPARRSSRPSTRWSATASAGMPVIGVASSDVGRRRRCASGPTRRSPSATGDDVDEAAWKGSPTAADATSAATTGRRPPSRRWPSHLDGRRAAAVLPGHPAGACSTTSSQGLAAVGLDRPGLAGGGREAVRPRPGVGGRAQRGAPPGVPRGGDLPHRPLPRQGVGRGPAGVPVRQLDARAAVEPQLHLQRADHDGRGRSASRAAAGSTSRWARCGTCSRTTCCR